jgi:serine/threonine-protein kinase
VAETDEAPDPLIGRLLGQKFRIERLLGAGAMGRVYLAEQTNLGKQIALKVLHASMAGDASLAKRFYREAKSASMLAHPNILQIIDFGDDQGLLFIAMELLSGRDLYRAIKQDWPLSLDRIGHIGGQILSALDEAHDKGVIHRDLKPENVMLLDVRGEVDFVKVCDFGIAKVASERDGEGSAITVAGMVCGTPEYMSPEQAKGEPLDGRSDLYAMATILYQMVVGDVPFRAESALGVITKQLHEQPRPPSERRANVNCPPALEAVILRGLRKNREERFANAGDMKAALLESVGMRRSSGSGASIARSRATGLSDVALAATGVSTPIPSADGAATSDSASPAHPSSASASEFSATAPSPAVAATSSAPSGAAVAGPSASTPSLAAPPRSRGLVFVAAFAILGVLGTGAYVALSRSRTKPAVVTPASPAPPPSSTPTNTALPTGPAGSATAVSAPTPSPAPASPPTPSAPPPSNMPALEKATAVPIPNAHPPAPEQVFAAAPSHKHDRHGSKTSGGLNQQAVAAAIRPAPSAAVASSPQRSTPAVAAAAPARSAGFAAKPAAASGAHSFAGAFAEGEQLFRAGDVDGALARYQEAARLNPSDAKTQRQIGKCYNRLGQRDRAVPFIKRYLELAPDASDADFFRAQLDAK